ncbi:hypothetical protein JCM10295v2_002841 [Rhodotorula toruloides]
MRSWSFDLLPLEPKHSALRCARTTSFLFRYRIAPIYGQHFHALEFDKCDQAHLQAFLLLLLLLLPFMPKINELRLTLDGFEHVLHHETYYNPAPCRKSRH